MSEPPAENATRYDLFTRESGGGFVWRVRDRGVSLEPDAIVLMRAGQWTRIAFADIASITLSASRVGRMQLAQCTIALRNGQGTVFTNGGASGTNDGVHDGPFRLFVDDLHKALRTTGIADNIRFVSGFSAARMNGLIAITIIASVFFVGLPLVLLIATGELKALWITLVGLALVIPVWRTVQVNKPGTYSPANPPDMVA